MNASHAHNHKTHFDKALDVLRKAHCRITEPRRVILKVLLREHGPFTMEELHGRIEGGICDLVTVYRNLIALEKAGLVQRCEFGDGRSRYEFRDHNDSHHHHHIICTKCRKVETFNVCLVDGLERLVREKGYATVSHSLEFFGLCPKCQK